MTGTPAFGMGGMRRLSDILRILGKHGFQDLTRRIRSAPADQSPAASPGEDNDGEDNDAGKDGAKRKGKGENAAAGFPSPRRVRLALEELGPSFIKLGQLMSVRADIFPPEYIEEFRRLQDSVPPAPFDHVRETIERELDGPLDELFAGFDEIPLGAASVAQVHKAVLPGGDAAAVKIVRPGIAARIRKDIRVMYFLAARLESLFEAGRIIGFVNLVREFERTIFRELEMFTEAGNMERFSAFFADSEEIGAPAVYWSHVSRSVLTMEYIHGVKMDQVAEIRAMGADPGEVAMIGLRSFSRQLMEFGFFHADPHPANILIRPDGRVCLVDFGITGDLDEERMTWIAHLFLGYAERDYDMVMDALRGVGLISEGVDEREFRADLKEMSEPFYGRALQNVSVREVYDQVMRLVLRHRVRMPRDLLLLFKTLIQTEGLGKILGSRASLLEVTKPYARRLLEKGMDARRFLKNFGREARQVFGYLRASPGIVHDILRRTADGKHGVELRHTGFDRMTGRAERGLNRLTVGVIISASTIAGSLVIHSPVTGPAISLGGETVSLSMALGLSGYSIATILGVWLIWSIFRSGRM